MDERPEPTATISCAHDECDEIRVTGHLTLLPEGWRLYTDQNGRRYHLCPVHQPVTARGVIV